ncbi:MAG: hypothetical protein Q7S47_02125 [bacterium]|nr:hypothetical protein [bacterium]
MNILSLTNSPKAKLLFIGCAFLLLIRIPFFATQHIQEDAYIYFRCADTIASHGLYSYNIHDRVSACTSHLYSFIVASTKLLFGENLFIYATLVLNSILLIFGIYLIIASLTDNSRKKTVLWILSSMSPAALVVSYTGMETSLLIFCIGSILFCLERKALRWALYLSLSTLPWIRPDAIIIGGIIIGLTWIKRRKIDLPMAGSFIVGMATVSLFNILYFGALIQQTITAKMVAYHPDHTLSDILHSIGRVFLGEAGMPGFFLPLSTKFIAPFGWVFALIYGFVFVYFLKTKQQEKNSYYTIVILISLTLLPPIVYAAGGVIFPWYFWPSQLMGIIVLTHVLLTLLFEKYTNHRHAILSCLVLISALIATGQFLLSLNWGMQEGTYRKSIGMYLRSISQPGDTVMLEPIGYIPYFSRLTVHDEIGLASPRVTEYRKKYGPKWWIIYIQDIQPTFLVERSHIKEYKTLDGYTLTDDEKKYFDSHYSLVKVFTYNPKNFTSNQFVLTILSHGLAADYYVFKKK